MNTYKANTLSAPVALAAIVMSALTLALCVSAPTELAKTAPAPLAAVSEMHDQMQPPATEVDIVPGKIEVVAVREPSFHAALMRMLQPKRKQQV
jgi:starvation-inducible outer membrane lipoprotein